MVGESSRTSRWLCAASRLQLNGVMRMPWQRQAIATRRALVARRIWRKQPSSTVWRKRMAWIWWGTAGTYNSKVTLSSTWDLPGLTPYTIGSTRRSTCLMMMNPIPTRVAVADMPTLPIRSLATSHELAASSDGRNPSRRTTREFLPVLHVRRACASINSHRPGGLLCCVSVHITFSVHVNRYLKQNFCSNVFVAGLFFPFFPFFLRLVPPRGRGLVMLRVCYLCPSFVQSLCWCRAPWSFAFPIFSPRKACRTL